MTTIAYRDGIMAADSGSHYGDIRQNWARKIAQGPDGTLYGTSGDAAQCDGFLRWVLDGCEGDQPVPDAINEGKDSSFIILVVPVTGRIRLITARGEETYEAPYFAIGYDAGVAYGAMFAGKDAITAIDACIEHGTGSSGRVQTIDRSVLVET